jgi:hypothetical protein
MDPVLEYKLYLECEEKIPINLLEELNNLPNNKGFIWENFHLFGNLPRQKGKKTVLVKVDLEGNVSDEIIIHEYDKKNYNIYKECNNIRELIKAK